MQELGPASTIVHHNGGAPGGYGSLMIATPDAGTVLTAGITTGSAPIDLAEVFPRVLGAIVASVFGPPVGRDG